MGSEKFEPGKIIPGRRVAKSRKVGSPESGSPKSGSGRGRSQPTVVYIHGIGPQAAPAVVKRKYDEALFGHDMGDRTRLAYWSDILHSVQTTETSLAKALPSEAIPPLKEMHGAAKAWGDSIGRKLAAAELASRAESAQPTFLPAGDKASKFGPRILPPGPLRGILTEQFTRLLVNDAYQYLFLKGIKDRINRRLRDALTGTGPFVVIGHSLGSVIAFVKESISTTQTGQPEDLLDPIRVWTNSIHGSNPFAYRPDGQQGQLRRPFARSRNI